MMKQSDILYLAGGIAIGILGYRFANYRKEYGNLVGMRRKSIYNAPRKNGSITEQYRPGMRRNIAEFNHYQAMKHKGRGLLPGQW